MSVLKVVTDIITSIAANPVRRVAILVIMYVKTFKTDVIGGFFFGNIMIFFM